MPKLLILISETIKGLSKFSIRPSILISESANLAVPSEIITEFVSIFTFRQNLFSLYFSVYIFKSEILITPFNTVLSITNPVL